MDEDNGETLGELAEAIGQPSHNALENAKALFPFIAHEREMKDLDMNSDDDLVHAAECAKTKSQGR
ncbi:hypothetical protein [Streptomyces sp. NPDC048603]|uniref:hypothetical protein n=1 Tax=Streptomyces sp. NPDC048603 TaxID=3365577 RepID=UPI00371283CA